MHTHQIAKVAYSVPEAVQVIGLGRSRLYQEIGAGRLRAIKCGRRTLVTAAAIDEWLAAAMSAAHTGAK